MQTAPAMSCLFVAIGGVLLTDGWDRHARKRAAANFKLDLAEIEDRHQLTWDTHQAGTRAKLASLGLQSADRLVHETH